MTVHPRRRIGLMAALLASLILALTLKFLVPTLNIAIGAETAARRDLAARQTSQSLASYQPLTQRLSAGLPSQGQTIAALQQAARRLKIDLGSYNFALPRAEQGLAIQAVSLVLPAAEADVGTALCTTLESLLPNSVRLIAMTYEGPARNHPGNAGSARLVLEILGAP